MKKVSITNVDIEGFLSVGKPIAFDIKEGLTSIIGENRTDSYSTSNGSGKSSLIEAIVWCLSGSTSRGIKNDAVINMYYPEGCRVQVTLSFGAEGYQITRTRGGKFGNTLNIIDLGGNSLSGNTASKSQDILNDLLPFTYEDLTTLIILSQGMPGKLSSQKPSGRKAILEGIASYSEEITALGNLVSTKYNSVNAEASSLVAEINKHSSDIVSSRNSIKNYEEVLQKEIEAVKSHNQSVVDIESKNSEIRNRRSEASERLDKISSELNAISSERNERGARMSEIKSEIDKLASSRKTIETEMSKEEAEIRKISSELDSFDKGKCYVCGHDISDMTLLEKLRAEGTDRISKAESKIDELSKSIPEILAKIESSKMQVEDLTKGLSELSASASSLTSLANELKSVSLLVELPVPQLTDNTLQYLSIINDLTASIKASEGEVKKLEERRARVYKDSEILKKIQYDISRGTFRTFVLQKAVTTFNSILHHISIAIMKDKPIRLDFDGNNVEIMYGDKVYEQMSGGERNRVDIALELTKRKYKSIVTGLSFNLLVMDEVIDGLDSFGISTIFDAVEVSGACDSFLVISHRKDIELDYNRVFKVIKEDNCSRLEIEE